MYRVKAGDIAKQEEPTLFRKGDVLLVRKSDAGFVSESTLRLFQRKVSVQEDEERARLRRFEQMQNGEVSPNGRFYTCPPIALSGHWVICKDPTTFPARLCLRRVIGVGGQWIRLNNSKSKNWGQRFLCIPAHALQWQGEEEAQSRHLLVGVAEYIVWPPNRWQRIRRTDVTTEKGEPIAFWP